jgi:hypothetical protein
MELHFTLVKAGIWQCTERPEIQLRKMPRTRLGRNGFALPGWAVFTNGIEVRTCGREATKRHAAEEAERYVVRADEQLTRMTAEAERQLSTQREYERNRLANLDAAKANREAQQAADQRERYAGEVLALAGVTAATHAVRFDGAVVPREGIPCAHPEAARRLSADVWHPDTCGGCGASLPDPDATPTLGPAAPGPDDPVPVEARAFEIIDGAYVPLNRPRSTALSRGALGQLVAEARGPQAPRSEAPAPIREALERVTRAAYEAVEAALAAQQDAPPAADPATEDDSNELLDRIVRRAQYTALHAMLGVLDGWIDGAAEHHEQAAHRDSDCCRDFAPADIRRMVNDAAAELRVPAPYRDEAAR